MLEEIPKEIFSLSGLHKLVLWGNNIKIVPDRIRELPSLEKLDLWCNPIEIVPDIPGLYLDWESYLNCRQHLSPAHVFGLNIRTGRSQHQPSRILHNDKLSSEIVRLSSLRRLRMGFDGVTIQRPLNLPEPEEDVLNVLDRIGELPALEELILWGVLLRELPIGISRLRRLRDLEVISECVKELPAWISELRELETLVLRYNALTSLHDSLKLLTRLRFLDVGVNDFGAIPRVIFQIPTLEIVDISRARTLAPHRLATAGDLETGAGGLGARRAKLHQRGGVPRHLRLGRL
jgi:Leucine-rich repeat (LRR) protein